MAILVPIPFGLRHSDITKACERVGSVLQRLLGGSAAGGVSHIVMASGAACSPCGTGRSARERPRTRPAGARSQRSPSRFASASSLLSADETRRRSEPFTPVRRAPAPRAFEVDYALKCMIPAFPSDLRERGASDIEL